MPDNIRTTTWNNFLTELGVPPPDAHLHRQVSRSHRLADMLTGLVEQIDQVQTAAVVIMVTPMPLWPARRAPRRCALVHVEAGLRGAAPCRGTTGFSPIPCRICSARPDRSPRPASRRGNPDRILEVGDVVLDVALGVRNVWGIAARQVGRTGALCSS